VTDFTKLKALQKAALEGDVAPLPTEPKSKEAGDLEVLKGASDDPIDPLTKKVL